MKDKKQLAVRLFVLAVVLGCIITVFQFEPHTGIALIVFMQVVILVASFAQAIEGSATWKSFVIIFGMTAFIISLIVLIPDTYDLITSYHWGRDRIPFFG